MSSFEEKPESINLHKSRDESAPTIIDKGKDQRFTDAIVKLSIRIGKNVLHANPGLGVRH